MGKLFKPRQNQYTPQAGDTLQSIAASQTDGLDWQDVALFNWAVKDPAEVNRCIIEQLGCGELKDNPGETVIDPDRGPGGVALEIFIPELWEGELPVNQNHVIKAKKLKPACAITIDELDKWFIPKIESCSIKYGLQGIKERAQRVDLSVYGSAYCEISAWNDGFGNYGAPLNDEPVYSKELAADADERQQYDLTGNDWKGECNAASGALKSADERFINVAFSPYTVHLRYYKSDADASAALFIAPFWPEFESDAADAKARPDSLKIKWRIADADKLKQGHLAVYDKDDKPVFLQGLTANQLAVGEHEFDWAAAGGRQEVVAAKMPFRVQIQAHADMDEDDGLALAAMHTEVRLYVAPATHAESLDPYVTSTNASSLRLSLADVWHKDAAPTKGADGTLWTKFALAQAGFHPGPVTDANATDEYKLALHEFQKSVPKVKANPADDFERLVVSDNDDADTRNALENMAQHDKRAWCGKAADRSDYGNDDPVLQADLANPQEDVICWVNDRYWYTDAGWCPENNTTINDTVKNHSSALTEDRGGYTEGDNRVALDERDIARPWIPLQIQPILLSKSDALTTEKDLAAIPDDVLEASQLAIGALRVDWTFDEIDGDTIEVPEVDTSMYHKDRTRTQAALKWQLNENKAAHTRKDVIRDATYFNCLETYGGVRPTNTADYYKEVFGLEDKSLYPWTAKAESAREAVVSVVHDHLGDAHSTDDLFAKRRGRSGIYFNPSNMAGDGYQLRAQIRFEQTTDFKHPNCEHLKKRYPKLPQAHSAKIRVWRKASLRGYISWSPNDSFAGSIGDFRALYAASHMHFVNEHGRADAAIKFAPNTLFSDLAGYRAMVKETVDPAIPAPGDIRLDDANISVTPDKIWPWNGHDQLGIPEPSAANPPNQWQAAHNIYQTHGANYYYRLAVRLSSEIARLLEAKHGLMRGNVIVEMLASDQLDYRAYDCDTCPQHYVYLEKNGVAHPPKQGDPCPHPVCGGSLLPRPTYVGHYTCGNGHQTLRYESNSAGGSANGTACDTAGCGSTYTLDVDLRMQYECDTCNFQDALLEPSAAGGSHTGSNCIRGGCGGTLNPVGGAAAVTSNGSCVEHRGSSARKLYDHLPIASLGNPIGVALNFHGGYELWAHEVGHTRYMEHAANAPASRGGATAAAMQARVHDAVANPDPAVSASPESSNWDRACYMTYASHLNDFDPIKDKTYMCYKCVLKNRGWKIENFASDPPGAIRDV